jgi:para-nitrobenzyl esterase
MSWVPTPVWFRWHREVPPGAAARRQLGRAGTSRYPAAAWWLLPILGMKHLLLAASLLACRGGSPASPDAPAASPDAPATCAAIAGPAGEVVQTTSGALRGARDGQTWAYKRVPYAAPPIGPLRFRPPAPAACPSGIVDATALGPACPQLDGGAVVGDEDCLQLNVWAPATAAPPRPVLVWIHGGGNTVGSAVYPIYDGRGLAEASDAIVVTTNYRLGQLGFLGHPAFAAESPAGGQGTFGLLDQIAALAWVKANIAAVGGDPGNVTIVGESAGARDVCSLVAAPGAAGLLHRAIMESGACKFLPTRQAAEATAATVATAAGCQAAADVAACLRALPAATLVQAAPASPSALDASPYNPMIDGVVQPDQPEAVIRAGHHHHVPFVIGANADETGKDAPMITTDAQYQAAVRATFPQPLADRVIAQYPSAAYPSPRAAFVRVTTDARFVCPSREIAAAVHAAQAEPVYRYFFQYRPSPLGAVHGLDVPYVFGTFSAVLINGLPYTPSATDLALSAAIQARWAGVARAGAPGGTPAWPAYDDTDPALVLDATLSTTAAIRKADCDFWQPYYRAQ